MREQEAEEMGGKDKEASSGGSCSQYTQTRTPTQPPPPRERSDDELWVTAVSPDPLGLLPNPSLGHCTLGDKPEAGLGLAKDTARPAIRPDLPFSFSITSLEWGNNVMNEGREIIRQPDILPSRVEKNAELGESPLLTHFLSFQSFSF